LTVDLEHPAFRAGLERLRRIAEANARAKARGGVPGGIQRAGLALAAAVTFARLFALPAAHHELPAQVRLAPAW
jgi:magnesium-protoporphyrin IX monomethyl ester (oxidative) cyclase